MFLLSSRSPDRIGYLVAWVLIVTIALALRVWQFPLQLLADDEWHALNRVIGSTPLETAVTFGNADHSIPLTLFYFLLSVFTPLTENLMRLPMLLAGMASIIAIPRILHFVLTRQERLLLGGLLAVSPLLVYYSRTARPYAISTLLAVIAIIYFFHWFRTREKQHAVGYILCAACAAWLLPVTLSILLAPFLFFGMIGLGQVIRDGQWHDMKSLFLLGLATLVPLIILLGPPMYFSLGDITGRAGVNTITLSTLVDTFRLLAGSEYTVIILTVAFLALYGAITLMRRNRLLCLYLLTCSVIAFVICIASGAAWIHHPLVVARYVLPALPILLLLITIGVSTLVNCFLPDSSLAGRMAVIMAPLLLATFGPLRAQYHQPLNQFTGHMAYQFDYDWETNIYNDDLDVLPISEFYQQLGGQPAGQYHLAIAPWFIYWHWNRWYLDQRVHQQRVSAAFLSGFCGSGHYGEYGPGHSRIDLQHITHLVDLVPGENNPGNVDFLVYQKTPARTEIDYRPFEGCLERIRETFGKPYFEDDHIVVYQLGV